MTSQAPLSHALRTDADALRRSLRGVIREASEALDRMDQGGRPGTSITGSLLHSARTVESLAARVDLLLNYAGSDLLPHADASSALRGA